MSYKDFLGEGSEHHRRPIRFALEGWPKKMYDSEKPAYSSSSTARILVVSFYYPPKMQLVH